MPVPSRPSTLGDSAVRSDGRTPPRRWPAVPRPTAANRLRLAAKARPPTQISQPRQPISEPTAAAMGTPITKVSDWPLITQPSARPRWLSGTRPETSAKTTPMKAPLQPPPTVAHTAIQRKEPASACASTARAREKRAATRRGRRPTTSDNQPPSADVRPHDMDVRDTRLATIGMLTSRSCAMSSRKGARVVPLEVAANEPRQAAPIRAHGRAAGRTAELLFIVIRPPCRPAPDRAAGADRSRHRAGRRRN